MITGFAWGSVVHQASPWDEHNTAKCLIVAADGKTCRMGSMTQEFWDSLPDETRGATFVVPHQGFLLCLAR